MDIDTLVKKLDLGESYELEFKAAEDNFPNDAWKTISAFARPITRALIQPALMSCVFCMKISSLKPVIGE